MNFLRSQDDPSKSRTEIVIHFGAHKTATTYFQARLARSVGPLLEGGVCFVPVSELRKKIIQVRNPSSLLNMIPGVRDWRTAEIFRKYLQKAEKSNCDRLVFSEENLLGSLKKIVLSGRLYASVDARFDRVFKGLERRPVTALLAVRSYDTFMSAVWSQLIRQEGYQKMDEQSKARLLTVPRGWVEVVDDIIRSLPPGSKLRIWCYEDLMKLQNEIMSLFVGVKNVDSVELVHESLLPSLTIQAMKRLENLHAQGKPTRPEDVKRVGKKFSKDKGFKTYSLWTEEERSLLVSRYEKDIAHIRKRWPDLILHAPSDSNNI